MRQSTDKMRELGTALVLAVGVAVALLRSAVVAATYVVK